jgi:hypothetical protein
MKREQHLNHPGLEPLWQSLEREWLVQLISLLMLITGGVIFLAVSLKGYWLMTLLGGIISAIGAYYLYFHLSRPRALDSLLEILYETPQEVVWIYSIVNDHHPFQRGILYFKLINGDEISANLPPRKLKLISKILSRALPDTVFGYSNERARRYSQNPTSLKDVN